MEDVPGTVLTAEPPSGVELADGMLSWQGGLQMGKATEIQPLAFPTCASRMAATSDTFGPNYPVRVEGDQTCYAGAAGRSDTYSVNLALCRMASPRSMKAPTKAQTAAAK
jgi:hypothetical protein